MYRQNAFCITILARQVSARTVIFSRLPCFVLLSFGWLCSIHFLLKALPLLEALLPLAMPSYFSWV
jgi:hypothetical protein